MAGRPAHAISNPTYNQIDLTFYSPNAGPAYFINNIVNDEKKALRVKKGLKKRIDKKFSKLI